MLKCNESNKMRGNRANRPESRANRCANRCRSQGNRVNREFTIPENQCVLFSKLKIHGLHVFPCEQQRFTQRFARLSRRLTRFALSSERPPFSQCGCGHRTVSPASARFACSVPPSIPGSADARPLPALARPIPAASAFDLPSCGHGRAFSDSHK